MTKLLVHLFLFVTLFVTVLALECYTGFKYLAGQRVGTSKETCSSPLDYCYNATADVTNIANLKLAGCSTTRCFMSHNKCIKQTIQGKELQFCCCNTGDLCNSKTTNMNFIEKTKEKVKDWTRIFTG